ncbi:MAG: GNAT family N-acetyltransferase [Gammaproteobacteria bacterium]
MLAIEPARFPADLAAVRRLFEEYAASLGVDLGFQGFERELANLPGAYAPPAGRLLLAWREAAVVGCVGLRPLAGADCEMKRLYVQPTARGQRAGQRLVECLIGEARAMGYARILLDTLPTMAAAQALYVSLGFREIPAYCFNPIAGTKYYALAL